LWGRTLSVRFLAEKEERGEVGGDLGKEEREMRSRNKAREEGEDHAVVGVGRTMMELTLSLCQKMTRKKRERGEKKSERVRPERKREVGWEEERLAAG
jgi:hypothetical protein